MSLLDYLFKNISIKNCNVYKVFVSKIFLISNNLNLINVILLFALYFTNQKHLFPYINHSMLF